MTLRTHLHILKINPNCVEEPFLDLNESMVQTRRQENVHEDNQRAVDWWSWMQVISTIYK